MSACDRWISVADSVKVRSTDEWPTQYRKAIARLRLADCKGAWDEVWPLARSGDLEAWHLLAEMSLEGMFITNNSDNIDDAVRFFTYSNGSTGKYSLYGEGSRSLSARWRLKKKISDMGSIKQKEFLGCLEHDQPNICANMSKDINFIPQDKYVKYIDSMAPKANVPLICKFRND